jgi:hypothetical protein
MTRDVVTILGVAAGLAYYVLTVRNQKRSRQAQLLMNLYEAYRNTESRKQSLEIQNWEWKNFEEFFQKYGNHNPEEWAKWEAKASFFNGIGILLKRDLIDIELLDDLLWSSVNRHWNVLGMGPVLVEWRKRLLERRHDLDWRHDSRTTDKVLEYAEITAFHGFDYLYDRLLEYRETHP